MRAWMRSALLGAACLLAPARIAAEPPAVPPPPLDTLERELFEAVNGLRTQPTAFVADLERMRAHFSGRRMSLPGEITLLTQEGVAPVEEAIAFLKAARVEKPFALSCGMVRAARDHARDLAGGASIGHSGSDGSTPSDRLRRYGRWRQRVGENVALGSATGRRMALQLLIDDGVPSRGHRQNLFKADFSVIGVGCDRHPQYRTVCVIDFAGRYEEPACDLAHPQNPTPPRKDTSEN